MLPLKIGDEIPKHADYADEAQSRAFWRTSDRAAKGYAKADDAGGYPVLPKHENEPGDRYKRRQAQALARPYVRQIINRYNDHVCRQETERPKATGAYGDFLADATGSSMPWPQVLRKALRLAQVERCAYILADSSTSDLYVTEAQAQQAGQKPIARLIPADAVVWWREWEGQLQEAYILMDGKDGNPFLWYVSETETQRITLKNTASSHSPASWRIASIDKPRAHTYKGCPLVRVCVDPADDGQSQAAPIAESQKRICVLDSLLLDEIQSITFTTTVLLGISVDQVKEISLGAGHMLCLPSSGTSNPGIGKVSADVAQAESIRKSLEYEARELYRVAGLSAGNPFEPGAPESGVAKAFAFNEIEAALASLADSAQTAENIFIHRIADGFWGGAYPGDAHWPEEFQVADLSMELDRTIKLDVSNAPQILKQKAWVEYGKQAFTLDDAEVRELNEQAEEVTEPSLMADVKPAEGKPFG